MIVTGPYRADVQLFCYELRQAALFLDEDMLHKGSQLHCGFVWRDGHGILADSRPLDH